MSRAFSDITIIKVCCVSSVTAEEQGTRRQLLTADLKTQTRSYQYTWHTIASKINHDVRLSVHESGECERSDIAPHFEGSEEGIVDDLLVQVHGVAQDSGEEKGNGMKSSAVIHHQEHESHT